MLDGLTLTALIEFSILCVLIEVTPGPNMAYLAVLAATEGRHKGYAAVLGVALGLGIVGILAALGLAAIIEASPVLFQALRWGGVAYLLWLAWDSWRGGSEGEPAEFEAPDARYFKRGLIVNLLNPKAGVFYVAMLPRFVASEGHVLFQTVTLSLVYVGIATLVHATIVTAAGGLQDWLSSAERRRAVQRVMAIVLIGIALWFALET